MADIKQRIAARAAKEFEDGYVVNLGIGLPTLVANYVPEDIHVVIHSENGFTGLGEVAKPGEEDYRVTNAGAGWVTYMPYACFFDSAESFAIIRGGHLDVTILGAMQVDEAGNLANWIVPGKMMAGMGGAMDLVSGAKKVVIAMQHTQKGTPKILKECTLPLTAMKCVDVIITEMCVMEYRPEGLTLTELHPDYTLEDVKAVTEASFLVADDLKAME